MEIETAQDMQSLPSQPVADKIDLMEERLESVQELATSCRLCPHECEVDRTAGELGTCRVGNRPMVSSMNLHYGEEPPISGIRGSGTIFLTGCNLRCLFCQNYPISQLRHGNMMETGELAQEMLSLQMHGAHNINLVTPTHQAIVIFEALLQAYKRGLRIPVVYNSNGYDSLEMLKLWDGIIDIYMPDAKYTDDDAARALSGADDYRRHNRAAILEMFRQVGNLKVDGGGIAQRGLLIRHLVLPDRLSQSEEVLRWIAEEVSRDVYLSLMSQYFPAWRAHEHPSLNRRLKSREYLPIMEALERLGLEKGWTQPV